MRQFAYGPAQIRADLIRLFNDEEQTQETFVANILNMLATAKDTAKDAEIARLMKCISEDGRQLDEAAKTIDQLATEIARLTSERDVLAMHAEDNRLVMEEFATAATKAEAERDTLAATLKSRDTEIYALQTWIRNVEQDRDGLLSALPLSSQSDSAPLAESRGWVAEKRSDGIYWVQQAVDGPYLWRGGDEFNAISCARFVLETRRLESQLAAVTAERDEKERALRAAGFYGDDRAFAEIRELLCEVSKRRHGVTGLCCQYREQERTRAETVEKALSTLRLDAQEGFARIERLAGAALDRLKGDA